jgi:hypothetical protein
MLAAFGVVLTTAAIYAFAPASTVRDEFSGRTPKAAQTRINRERSTQAPAKQARRSAGVGAAKVERSSASRPGTKQTGRKSKPRSTYQTRIFIWPAVPHASFYRVERVFEALASTTRLELPLRWTYRGRSYHLLTGPYVWRVSPAFGPRFRLRYSRPIIRSIWVARL